MNQITTNFNKREFNSKDGKRMPLSVFNNVKELAKNLQILRDEIGSPIHINSGYRSPSHNESVGGSLKSQHLLGKASDITCKDLTSVQLHDKIEELINKGLMKQGGLGLYNGFVHYDIRGINPKTGKGYRWDYRK